VFDAVGKLDSSHGKKALKKGGAYLNVFTASGGGEKGEELLFIKELAETGKIRPVIDRSYPLDQIVEAHRYVDKRHKRGNVFIAVAQGHQRSASYELCFLGEPVSSGSALPCVCVRLAPMSVIEFAPDLPPNSPRRRENPVVPTWF
jgi:hypothetical protein